MEEMAIGDDILRKRKYGGVRFASKGLTAGNGIKSALLTSGSLLAGIKKLDGVEQAVKQLEESDRQIVEIIVEVNRITEENHSAIGVIVRKNENTAQVADLIREQSEQNKGLAHQPDTLIGKFDY